MSARLRDSSGFTLIELLITTIISLALGVGGFAFFRAQAQSLTDQSAGLDAIEGARAALDFMAFDIRMAGANPTGTWTQGGTCGAGLSVARANELTIAYDGANAQTIEGTISADEITRYWYDSANKRIVRTVNGSNQTLITNVPSGGLAFEYKVGVSAAAMSGSPSQVTSAVCNNVTHVVIKVRVQTARGTVVTNVDLSSRVALRNRKAVLNRL